MTWPELPYSAWKDTLDTLDTLHMNLQIVGKVRLALTPFEPQWANVPLYLTSRGLTTTPMQSADVIFQIDVDLIDHHVVIGTVQGETRRVRLTARPVADFYADFTSNLSALTSMPTSDPSLTRSPIRSHLLRTRSIRPTSRNRRTVSGGYFHRLTSCSKNTGRAFEAGHRRCTSSGAHSTSPNTRYSGRPVTPPPGAGLIERLGGDAEVACAGSWPGNPRYPRPAFYAYTYPKPEGIERQAIAPQGAGWSPDLGEFALPYDEVRTSASPREAILQLFESTYAAGARLNDWDPSLVAR